VPFITPGAGGIAHDRQFKGLQGFVGQLLRPPQTPKAGGLNQRPSHQ
jgi:hypothetical protein